MFWNSRQPNGLVRTLGWAFECLWSCGAHFFWTRSQPNGLIRILLCTRRLPSLITIQVTSDIVRAHAIILGHSSTGSRSKARRSG